MPRLSGAIDTHPKGKQNLLSVNFNLPQRQVLPAPYRANHQFVIVHQSKLAIISNAIIYQILVMSQSQRKKQSGVNKRERENQRMDKALGRATKKERK